MLLSCLLGRLMGHVSDSLVTGSTGGNKPQAEEVTVRKTRELKGLLGDGLVRRQAPHSQLLSCDIDGTDTEHKAGRCWV